VNPLEAELVRMDLGLSKPGKRQGENEYETRTRQRQYGALLNQFGTSLVQSSEYSNADDNVNLRQKCMTLRTCTAQGADLRQEERKKKKRRG
jgi:hypothetical protein